MNQSNGSKNSGKPAKPHPDSALFPLATKRWAKKICGEFHFFGPWRDPDGALNKWLRVQVDLSAGRQPRAEGQPGDPTMEFVADGRLTRKEQLRDSGGIPDRTYTNRCVRSLHHDNTEPEMILSPK